MALLFESKTVIVTGIAGGIGLACAQAFLESGANVMASDMIHAPESLTTRSHCRFIQADLRNERAIQGLIERTREVFGSIDVLINNAAVIPPMSAVHDTTTEDLDQILSVNIRAPFLCSKYAYPYLKQSKGTIINISSMSGVTGESNHAAYSASKGGLNALTKAMAIDYGKEGIRCNAVCPSSVLTESVDQMIAASSNPEEIIEYRKKINHLGYTASPSEITSVVLFLASSEASFITGAIIPVSGGSECGYGIK